jgi:hypothetical protein
LEKYFRAHKRVPFRESTRYPGFLQQFEKYLKGFVNEFGL